MDLEFKDKVAIVTGSGSQIGMGKAISLTLAREGCDIVAADVDLEGAKKTAAEVEAFGHKAIAVRADVTSRAEVGAMVKAALEKFGKIDILVNNAGLIAARGPLAEVKEEDLEKDINVNLRGVINCTRAVLPHMLERKSGKIISISSIGGRNGLVNSPSYSAAKAGVIAFTKSVALQAGPSGINVNSVAPAMVVTNFEGGVAPQTQEGFKARAALRRLVTVQDIANAAAFLASDVSCNITGQTIHVDSGLCML